MKFYAFYYGQIPSTHPLCLLAVLTATVFHQPCGFVSIFIDTHILLHSPEASDIARLPLVPFCPVCKPTDH